MKNQADVSTEILSGAVIVEDDGGLCKKIEPDKQGGFNLFKQFSMGWRWDDSIGEDSAMYLIRHAHAVYRVC